MEVLTIESEAFRQLVAKVVQQVRKDYQAQEPKKWITGDEAKDLLGIKDGALQKLRSEGKIRYSQPSRKIILYDRESINAFLENNAHEAF